MTSAKERVWLEEYLSCWNATEAARRAKYKHPEVMGSRKMKKFSDEISDRVAAKAMTADEALTLLSEQARATIADFLEFDPHGTGIWRIDIQAAHEAGKLGVIKELWIDHNNQPHIKLYDKQKALELILRAHGAFKDAVEHTGVVQVEYVNDWRNSGEDPAT